MVRAVAILVFLFYFSQTPVQFGVHWTRGAKVQLGWMFGPVRFRFLGQVERGEDGAWRAQLTSEDGARERQIALPPRVDVSALAGGAKRAATYFLGHVHAVRLRASLTLASGDAARDALLCGAMTAAVSAVRAAWPELPLRARVCVNWRGGETQGALLGIWSIKAGHIIAAALLGAGDYLVRRISAWKNTLYREL